MDKTFKALADPTRLAILEILANNGDTCVCKLCERLDMGQPAISQHLAKLKNAGLVRSRKEGQWVHYSIVIESFASGPFSYLARLMFLAGKSADLPSDKC